MRTFISVISILIIANAIYGENAAPIIDYSMDAPGDYIEILKFDWQNGSGIRIDSIPITSSIFAKGIDWSLYDPINHRIFYQEVNIPLGPIYMHVYEINTRKSFDLPYENYFGDHAEMIISPDSKYILLSCLAGRILSQHYNEAALQEQQDKMITYVLDGSSLNLIATRTGMDINVTSPTLTFISNDNMNLVNVEYSRIDNIFWAVIYSLPKLNPVDSINISSIGWQGYKYIRDAYSDLILIKGKTTDSSNGLRPGDYIFVVDYKTKNIVSPFIESTGAIFSPDGTELISYWPEKHSVIRYSPTTGGTIGETVLPEGVEPRGMTFRTDNKLYISDKNNHSQKIVVDYKNDRVDKIIQLEQQ